MPRPSALSPEQWALARRRWEGAEKEGFAWLAREIAAAWGVAVLRKSLEQWARAKGWEKGGQPLAELPAMAAPAVANAQGKIPCGEGKIPLGSGNIPAAAKAGHEVASEVVERPAPPTAPAPATASTKPEHRGPGRPTLYKPEFANLLIEFFTKEPYTTVDVPQPNGMVKRQRMATDPPMLQTFAESIGVSKATVDAWATAINPDGSPRHPDFCAAYAHARAMQESLFSRAGMLGLYEPRFLAFAMKNLCGWQDQPAPKVDHAAVSKEELDRRFGQRMEAARQRQMEVLEERRRLRRLADEASGSDDSGLASLGCAIELPGGASSDSSEPVEADAE